MRSLKNRFHLGNGKEPASEHQHRKKRRNIVIILEKGGKKKSDKLSGKGMNTRRVILREKRAEVSSRRRKPTRLKPHPRAGEKNKAILFFGQGKKRGEARKEAGRERRQHEGQRQKARRAIGAIGGGKGNLPGKRGARIKTARGKWEPTSSPARWGERSGANTRPKGKKKKAAFLFS